MYAVNRCGILDNSEFQQVSREQKMWFLLLRVAFADPLQNVLGESKKVKFTGNLQCSSGQETNEAAVVLQLAKGPLCLNRPVDSQ